jgi:hypothetical protein
MTLVCHSATLILFCVGQVLLECKDEQGVQKFVAVSAQAGFSEVLQRLQAKYGRPVTFVYEAEGVQNTVTAPRDLRKCWDVVEAEYRKKGSAQKAAQLDAFVVDFDASKQEASVREIQRGTLAPPLKTKRPGESESALSKLRRGAGSRDPIESVDFNSKHKWIDDMMKALGAQSGGKPPTMQGRWETLLSECRQIDSYMTGTVTLEGFRSAVTRTEPRMSAEQVEWFVKDAHKVRPPHAGMILLVSAAWLGLMETL